LTYLKADEAPIVDADADADDELNGGGEEWDLCCFCVFAIDGVHGLRVLNFLLRVFRAT
jgi:hypothetical protein